MPWLSTHILSVINVNSHTSVGGKVVHKPWIRREKGRNLIQNNLFALDAALFKLLTAKNMEKSLFLSNVVFAVQLLSGFAGEILIFVTNVIKSKFQVNIYRGCQKTSCLNAKVKENAQWQVSLEAMAASTVWDVEYVEVTGWTWKIFDDDLKDV